MGAQAFWQIRVSMIALERVFHNLDIGNTDIVQAFGQGAKGFNLFLRVDSWGKRVALALWLYLGRFADDLARAGALLIVLGVHGIGDLT
jgi:hypothetical protein